jgi:hypothetical protein
VCVCVRSISIHKSDISYKQNTSGNEKSKEPLFRLTADDFAKLGLPDEVMQSVNDDDMEEENDEESVDVGEQQIDHSSFSFRFLYLCMLLDERMRHARAARRGVRELPPELASLLGMANVKHAQGQTTEALQMISEVIRQCLLFVDNISYVYKLALSTGSRNPDPYRHLAMIYEDTGDEMKRLQLELLAAHLDNQTPGEQWVQLGEDCEKMNDSQKAIMCYSNGLFV